MPTLINAINDRILSAFSNLFLLASLPYFPNVFEGWKERFSIFRKPEQWVNSVFIFFAIVTIIFTLIDRNVESDFGKKAIIAIDSVISTATMTLISLAIYRSISRFWSDTFLKGFLFAMFIMLISTQVVLPMIAIFPDIFKPFYMGALITLLLGLVFFNFVSVAYFGMVHMEMKEILQIDSQKQKPSEYFPEAITIGFDNVTRNYFVRILFHSSGDKNETKVISVNSAKLLQPFANWVLFGLAKKHNVKLSHIDLSTTKFRMVEFWNKESDIKLTQDALFNNDRGMFDLKLDTENIHFENMKFLYSKFVIREAVIKHEDSFKNLKEKIAAGNSFAKTVLQERLVDEVFEVTK
jgi:hypothetical protein